MSPMTHLLIGVDFSDLSALALQRSLDFLHHEPTVRLTVAHVCPADVDADGVTLDGPDGAPISTSLGHVHAAASEYVERTIASYEERTGRKIDRSSVYVCAQMGPCAAAELANIAVRLNAEAILVGSHGRRAVGRLRLGSVAEELMHCASCPVMVVRPFVATTAPARQEGRGIVTRLGDPTPSSRPANAAAASAMVDEASDESFPASDPPSFSPNIVA